MEAKTARVTEVVDKAKARLGAQGQGPSSPDRQAAAKEVVRSKVGAIKEARRGGRPERKPREEGEQGRGKGSQKPRTEGPERRAASEKGGDKDAYRTALLKRRAERQAASKKEG